MRAVATTLAASLVASLAAPRDARAQDADQTIAVPTGDEYADTDPSALTDFHSALDPYGQWVDDGTYGTVWTPDPAQVGPGFQPYDTNGSWDYVDSDYVWLSGYDWGWLCFHYGRWAWAGNRWVWIPGRDYAGAWVNWSIGDDQFAYLGWAPMPPSWGWFGGTATALGFGSPEPWTFSSYGDFFAPSVPSHSVTGAAGATVASHSRPYVRAQPHVVAAPTPNGPPPSQLGIDIARVNLPALPARELRARQLARPSTATPLGAHAPAAHVLRARPAGAVRAGLPARATPTRGRR